MEIELPDQLFGAQLHRVIYSDERPIHVDHFLRARFDPRYARVVYEASLLSKTILWAPEKEIRFLSKSQQKEIVIDGSIITRVILGPALQTGCRVNRRRTMTDSAVARTVGQSTCGSGHRPPAPTVPQSDPDRQGNHAHSQLEKNCHAPPKLGPLLARYATRGAATALYLTRAPASSIKNCGWNRGSYGLGNK